MKKISPDPNEEVEKWKDALYEEIKNLSGRELRNHLEENAQQILKKYQIKCTAQYYIKRPAQTLVHV
ncbi:hypothetical protein AUJ66_07800 [Candidatus Desantisbacteria bacterium CG1_02_38_46]|uniref:Uncharacterized protein n=1 Tax=Candidatus Desantisbacteria bacterium CG1_02_38_46 TaxID=1817893 RepID=A0A1J4SBB8_9BACT|nr:MAG: hypothetical protein AUJ66_07800 [Candidatus Desantisbacteria bacterium CG1_02_38_46]